MAQIDKKTQNTRGICSNNSRRRRKSIDNDDDYDTLDLKYKKLLDENRIIDEKIVEFHNKGITNDLNHEIMEVLHRYNEMKDSTSVVLDHLANIEQISVADLYKRYRLPTK